LTTTIAPATTPPASGMLALPTFSGLPATYILVTAVDPFRDEALAWACRLVDAGVPVELDLLPGARHMFDIVAAGTRWSHGRSAAGATRSAAPRIRPGSTRAGAPPRSSIHRVTTGRPPGESLPECPLRPGLSRQSGPYLVDQV
jgi:acetyl esterase/lipase